MSSKINSREYLIPHTSLEELLEESIEFEAQSHNLKLVEPKAMLETQIYVTPSGYALLLNVWKK